MSYISIIVLLIALEAAYVYVCLNAAIREKLGKARNTALFFGIVTIHIISGIFHMSIFRLFIIPMLVLGLSVLLCKNRVHFYVMPILILIYGVRSSLEALALALAFESSEYITISMQVSIIASFIFFITASILFIPLKWLCEYIHTLWHKEDTFIIRWVLCITATASVFGLFGLLIQPL